MHHIAANYTLPTVLNTLKPAANSLQKPAGAKTNASSTTGTTNTTSTTSSDGGLGSTFLNLLAQELQNQDPTAPVDSTAMVGQMISLNQLDQLISINQGINNVSSSTTTGQAKQAGASSDSSPYALSGAAQAIPQTPKTDGVVPTQLPFDPNTLMPVGVSNSGAVAATINSSLNAANLNLSGTTNNTSGGK